MRIWLRTINNAKEKQQIFGAFNDKAGEIRKHQPPFYFHLVLPHLLWIIGKEETEDWEEKMGGELWTDRAGWFCRECWNRSRKPRERYTCKGRGSQCAYTYNLSSALVCSGIPWHGALVGRVKGLCSGRHVPVACIPPWVTTIIQTYTAPCELLGFPTATMGECGSKKYNLWVLFYTGLMFFLFIKVLETSLAYAVYLALECLNCKAVKLGSLFFKGHVYFAHWEI